MLMMSGGSVGVFDEYVLGREVAIANGVDVRIADGADPGQDHRIVDLLLRDDLVAWIIPKDVLSLVFSTLGVV